MGQMQKPLQAENPGLMEALKEELMALETRYWNALKDHDPDTAASLSGDTSLVVGYQGVGEITREAMPKMMEQSACQVNGFSLEDVHIQQLSDDIVAVAYTVNENMTVEGKKQKLKAYDSSVWKRTKDGWVCMVHTETPANNPFGPH